MKHIQIAPSILSADFSAMGQAVETLQRAGADLIHCDVMDGSFVPNITFGHHMVRDIRKHTSLPLDVHLMIERPERHVENFIKAGADIVTVHHEACGASLKDVLRLIRSLGAKCGAVINPDTPVSAIEGVLPFCDMALVMSVFPGFGGQKFMPEVLEKIKAIRALADLNKWDLEIEIDGGVTSENVGEIKRAGANVIVAGSSVFKAADRRAAIGALRNN